MLIRKPALLSLFLLLTAAVMVVSCDALDNLTEPELIIPPTTTPVDPNPGGPTPTRRPAPTPLPTEELARPRSESPDPVPTAVELSAEEQAELGLASIQAAQRAVLVVNALRANITNENLSSGERSAILLEFVRPNSYRLVTDELELIVAAGQTFIMDKTANWLVSTGEQMERFGTHFDPFTNEQLIEARLDALSENIKEMRFVGEEEVRGNSTRKFTYSEQAAGNDMPVRTTVWIGIEDGLLYRQVVTYTTEGENYQVTTDFVYGDSVRIEAPWP